MRIEFTRFASSEAITSEAMTALQEKIIAAIVLEPRYPAAAYASIFAGIERAIRKMEEEPQCSPA